MFSHVYIGTNDFERACVFYAPILAELGLVQKFSEPEKFWAGWMSPGQPRPLLLIGRPYNGAEAQPGNGQMIALLAADRACVRRVYETALRHGACCEGEPGLHPHYHADYFGAYFRDLDGNKIAISCHTHE